MTFPKLRPHQETMKNVAAISAAGLLFTSILTVGVYSATWITENRPATLLWVWVFMMILAVMVGLVVALGFWIAYRITR